MVTRIVQGWRELNTVTYISGQPIAAFIEGEMAVRGVSAVTYKGVGTANNVADGVRTTIFSVVADDLLLNITNVVVSGEAYAKYFLVYNAADLDVRRSGPDRNLEFDFKGSAWELNYGDIIDVQVEHSVTSELLNFGCTVYGYGDIGLQIVRVLTPLGMQIAVNEPIIIAVGQSAATFNLALTVHTPVIVLVEHAPATLPAALTLLDPTILISVSPSILNVNVVVVAPIHTVFDSPSTLALAVTLRDPVVSISALTETLPLLMGDVLLDRTVLAPHLYLTMGDIRLDRTLNPVTLTISLGDIRLDSAANPVTLTLSMGDIRLDKDIKPVTLIISLGDLQLDKTVQPITLVIT